MIKVINHRAQDLPKALLINNEIKKDVIDICIQYHDELSTSVILENIQNTFGIESMVFASFVLGQLTSISQNKLFNLNLRTCQRVN